MTRLYFYSFEERTFIEVTEGSYVVEAEFGDTPEKPTANVISLQSIDASADPVCLEILPTTRWVGKSVVSQFLEDLSKGNEDPDASDALTLHEGTAGTQA